MNGSIIRQGPSGDYTDTLPSAANLVAAVPNAAQGMFFDFNFYNATGAVATLQGGSGFIKLDNNAASFDLAATKFRAFRLFFANVSGGSEAVYMVPLSTAMDPLT